MRLPDCCKLAVNWKNKKFLAWRHRQFSWGCFVSLVRFSYWSKFHVNIITVSWVMTISFYKGLTRSPEIGNTPSKFCIWRLGQARNTKFGTNVSNKMLLNVAKCQCYSFYRFWVIRKNQLGVNLRPSPTQIRVKIFMTKLTKYLNIIYQVLAHPKTFMRSVKLGLLKTSRWYVFSSSTNTWLWSS